MALYPNQKIATEITDRQLQYVGDLTSVIDTLAAPSPSNYAGHEPQLDTQT